MKSFLDRFKRRDPDERAPEVASERIGNAGAPADKPAPAIHVVNLEAESKAPVSSSTPPPAAPSQVTTGADSEVRLQLGDFLHRIPQNLLRPGPHDVTKELRFDVAELSSLISRGQTSINLADLYSRAPGIFRAEVRAEDNVEVRFPWQKLMSIVKAVGSAPVGKMGITQAAADALAHKLRSRRPTRNTGQGSATGVAAKSQPAPVQESVIGEADKSGTGGRQPAWVNKREAAAPSPEGSPLPAAQRGVTQEETLRDPDAANLKYDDAEADLQRQMAALSEEQQIEFQQCLNNGSSEDATVLIADREAVQRELAEKAAELEQLRNEIAALKKSSDERFAAISTERETLAREHDKVVADREAARKELADKIAQIEAQQNVGTRGGEEVASLAAERDALKKELAAKTGELETLKGQIAILGKKNDEGFAAIEQERDKVRAELENARKELAQRIEQVEFQAGLAAKSAEDTARLVEERDALKKDLSAKDADFEALKAQLAALTQSGDDTGEHVRIAAELQRAREELTARDEKIAFQQELSAKSAEDAVKLVSEREALRKEVAAKTSDLETTKTDLTLLRQDAGKKHAAIAAERDKVLADLKRTREELAGKVEQVELQQSLVTRSGEDSAKANADREALQKELEARTGELDSLKKALASLQKTGDEKAAEFAQGQAKTMGELGHEAAAKKKR